MRRNRREIKDKNVKEKRHRSEAIVVEDDADDEIDVDNVQWKQTLFNIFRRKTAIFKPLCESNGSLKNHYTRWVFNHILLLLVFSFFFFFLRQRCWENLQFWELFSRMLSKTFFFFTLIYASYATESQLHGVPPSFSAFCPVRWSGSNSTKEHFGDPPIRSSGPIDVHCLAGGMNTSKEHFSDPPRYISDQSSLSKCLPPSFEPQHDNFKSHPSRMHQQMVLWLPNLVAPLIGSIDVKSWQELLFLILVV